MKTIVNRLSGAEATGVDDVYSFAGEFVESIEYAIEVPTLGEDGANIVLPVRSVGRNRANGRLYFSTDDRFVRHVGFDCVWPVVKTVTLKVSSTATGRWHGAVTTTNGVEVYATSTSWATASDVESYLRNWCERNDYDVPSADDDDEPPPTIPIQAAA